MLGYCPGAVSVNVNLTTATGFFIEMFGTLFLVLTVLSTTNGDRKHAPSYLQPLSIGIAIFVLHMFLVSCLTLNTDLDYNYRARAEVLLFLTL